MLRKAQLYGRRWRVAKEAHLADNPLCVMCLREGVVTEATVVDHTNPHRGDPKLFYDPTNWQSLCKRHHDSVKQREDNYTKAVQDGTLFKCDEEGYPVELPKLTVLTNAG